MPHHPPRQTSQASPTRRLGGVTLAAVLVGLLGCQEPEIERYKVPRAQAGGEPARLLAAIVAHAEGTWFFRLSGPEAQVNAEEGAFLKLVESLRFGDSKDSPVTWTVPKGWKQEKGAGMRKATLRPEAEGSALELTVITLGAEAGTTLQNVNRWRGQLGLAPISEVELGQFTRQVQAGGKVVTVVDLKGRILAGGAGMPPAGKGEEPRQGLKYEVPEGWKEAARPVALSIATFEVKEGAATVQITVTPLAGAAGGLLANVNRWRGQIGQPPVSEEQLRKEVKKGEVAGAPAEYVDLLGAERGAKPRERILAVVVTRPDRTWFLKMMGPADLVEKQKPAFEKFVKSVRF